MAKFIIFQRVLFLGPKIAAVFLFEFSLENQTLSTTPKRIDIVSFSTTQAKMAVDQCLGSGHPGNTTHLDMCIQAH